jgi:hypothetical protein
VAVSLAANIAAAPVLGWQPVLVAGWPPLALQDETRADMPDPNLTDIETTTLAALSTEHGTYVRLEQERLPSPFVLDQLSRAMERHCPNQAR